MVEIKMGNALFLDNVIGFSPYCNKIIEVEGWKHPNAERGWDRKWVGVKYADGSYYMTIFDEGKDWVPSGNRVTSEEYEEEWSRCFMHDGWTQRMTSDEIQEVAGVSVST